MVIISLIFDGNHASNSRNNGENTGMEEGSMYLLKRLSTIPISLILIDA